MKYNARKPQWRKHLRKYWQRVFWKRERQNSKKEKNILTE